MAYFAPYIDVAGLHLPLYSDIIDYLTEQARLIFGSDIYLGEDSQDYQLMSTFARCIFDAMQLAELNYNNRSPGTAIGAALDTLVAITGYLWSLPDTVTIGTGGTVDALATCQELGPVVAVPGDLSIIGTPTAGWTSVTNADAADIGRAVETDAELRARQKLSVANPSQTILESLTGGLAAVPGVSMVRVYENDTNSTDANGLPPHSIEAVVEGGDDYDIAYQLNLRKDDGVSTNGTESETVIDAMGQSHEIKFSRPEQTPIYVSLTIKKLLGYKGADSIKQAVADYVNALGIGEDVYSAGVIVAAMQTMTSISSPEFTITNLTLGTTASPTGTSDIAIGYRGKATCVTTSVTVTEVE